MNKSLLSALVVFFLSASFTNAQVYTAKDGTVVHVKSRNGDPRDIHRLNIFFGFLMEGPDMDVARFVRVGYFHPDLGSAYISAGINAVACDLNYFAIRKYKEGFVSNSLKTDGNVRYVAKLPVTKQNNFAPHLAANYYFDPYRQYFQVCPGLSIVRNRHLRVETDIRKMRGESIFRLNLDAVVTRQTGNPEEKSNIYNNIGVRTYFDGRLGTWSKNGIFSFNYMLGVFYDTTYFHAMAGIGFGLNFL